MAKSEILLKNCRTKSGILLKNCRKKQYLSALFVGKKRPAGYILIRQVKLNINFSVVMKVNH